MFYVTDKFYKNITFKNQFFNIWKQIKNMYLIRNSEYKSQDQIPISNIPSLTSSKFIVVVVTFHFYKVLGNRPILARIPDGYPT
jgi:hypothetical protein